MPIRAIYAFHNLLSRQFIFLRCGKSRPQFTIHLLPNAYLKTVVSVFKKSRFLWVCINRSPVFRCLFHSLSQPLKPLRTIKIIKKCGARIKAYQIHCFLALALSLFFGMCKKQRIEYVFCTNNSLLYRQNIKKSKLYV